MKRLRNFISLTLIVFFASTITACAEMYRKPDNGSSSQTDKFEYSIKFDAKSGKLVILNNEGKAITGKPVKFPDEHLPVDAIINVHTIIEAKGSCLIIVSGFVYNLCPR
ncbi:MAG: hypothetical protein ABW152_08715 [Candidatus Thiodiazotropha endolucinida]